MFNQLSHSQKKWYSLAVAVILACLASMLTGCGNREAEQAATQQKARDEAAAVFLKQGSGKVRQWGQKPASEPARGGNDAKK
ncbi:MAG: hypothetical protein WA191_19265 [Telluria sp.]